MSLALHQRRLFCCLVAVLLTTGGLPAATVSAASGPVPPVSFADDFPTEQRGDVAEIGVREADADVATLRVGSGSNHVLTAVVRDRDDDGRATLRLNTYDGSVAASDGDAVAVQDRSNVTTPLVAGRHDLDLWRGNGTDGERWAVGTLVVRQRSTDSLRTWVAPGSANLSNLSDVRTARSAGTLKRSRVVSERDVLVFELRASGLEGALAAQDGPNASARFFAAFDGAVGSVTVRHLTPGASQQSAVLDVSNHTATTVVPDAANDTYYLAVDLPDASMEGLDGGRLHFRDLRTGEYRATVTLTSASRLAEANESVAAEFTVAYPEADLDTPRGTHRMFLAPGSDQTVAGTTSLAPGTDLTVRIHDGVGNVLRSKTVAVRNGTAERNRFSAAFDFGDFEAGRNVTVTVRVADGPMLLGSRTGQEGTPGVVAVRRASVNLTERGLTAKGVLVENATLSHGGYLVVHRGSAEGKALVRSERLAPGEEFGQFLEYESALDSNATLVAVAHRAGPGDALGEPYTENGSVVADSVEFAVERETTASMGQTTTPLETHSTTVETRTPYPQEGVSGFGVGAALVALLAGLALSRRRENRSR